MQGVLSSYLQSNSINNSKSMVPGGVIPLHDGKQLPKRLEGNHLFKYSKVHLLHLFCEIVINVFSGKQYSQYI